MSRPAVSVVMPFAGDHVAAEEAVSALGRLRTGVGDELILADNRGGVSPDGKVTVVRADRERSPAHARNAGAARAHADWILFVDADCRLPATLLDDYFSEPVAPDVGALVGEIAPGEGDGTAAGSYGAARNFLSQSAHLAHRYLPRAAAANLLVRAAAFREVGGFLEGLRAAEDTDFTWRLQRAGWRLELRAQARVEHLYRASVSELRRQWRGYAAGRAWLARRYQGFRPQPAVLRAMRRLGRAGRKPPQPTTPEPRHLAPGIAEGPQRPSAPARQRLRHLGLDLVLAAEELRGLAGSNRPPGPARPRACHAVLVAERFPAHGDPLVELARAVEGAHVEARSRPARADPAAADIPVVYGEDDGAAERARAVILLVLRHPLRCLGDRRRRGAGPQTRGPGLSALAPAARRAARAKGAQVYPLGGAAAQRLAERVSALSGLPLSGGGT